jgi:hypothetical protein
VAQCLLCHERKRMGAAGVTKNLLKHMRQMHSTFWCVPAVCHRPQMLSQTFLLIVCVCSLVLRPWCRDHLKGCCREVPKPRF